ncbi:ParB/RepB/Spo0J family partition protein [Pedobacter cryophilus]|nr:ParB/RepB/Spo0J family partition protein [Pedobacter cryophilus]
MKDLNKKIQDLYDQVKNQVQKEELCSPENIEEFNIDELTRPEFHTKKVLPERLRTLTTSFHEHGFLGAIFINNKNQVIDGWHRLEIWKYMGNKTIPCIKLDAPMEHSKRLHLFLNQQVSLFTASDFGFTAAFEEFDLINDFGFSTADLCSTPVENNKMEKNDYEKGEDDNICNQKLIATIPLSYMKRIEELKKKLQLRNKSQVLMTLMDSYEKGNSTAE